MRAVSPSRMQFLVCDSDGISCAIDVRGVMGLSRTEVLQRDDMGFGCVGALPGDIPVFTLARFLGQAIPEFRRSMPIVILRDRTGSWGLIVERVVQLQNIPREELHLWPTVLQAPGTECFSALLQHDGKLYPVLRPEAMCPEERADRRESMLSVPERADDFRNGLPFQPSSSLAVFRTFSIAAGERPISFGLATGQVLEMLRRESVTRIPHLPPHVEGVISWQGRPIPAIDLGLALGLRAGGSEATRSMVIRVPDSHSVIAIATTPSVRMIDLPIDHLESSRTLSVRRDWTHGIVEMMNETLILPDLRKIAAATTTRLSAVAD